MGSHVGCGCMRLTSPLRLLAAVMPIFPASHLQEGFKGQASCLCASSSSRCRRQWCQPHNTPADSLKLMIDHSPAFTAGVVDTTSTVFG